MSQHAASGIHCRFPGGKRAPARLDREKQGYECDAPKVSGPPRGQHGCAQEDGRRERMQTIRLPRGAGQLEAQPPSSVLVVSAVTCSRARREHVPRLPSRVVLRAGLQRWRPQQVPAVRQQRRGAGGRGHLHCQGRVRSVILITFGAARCC